MSRPPADPKGFYRILGVAPEADAAAIKAAYRARAKDLHPDHNPDARAGEDFAKLNEAYQVLSDPRRRAGYDAAAAARGTRRPSGGGATGGGARARAQAYAQAQRRAEARTAEREPPRPHTHARPDAQAAPHPAAEPVATCRRCGKSTAQPRHVIFRMVNGLLTRSHVERIEGVFCRRCAQVTAVKASYATWLRGWWSLPRGPLDTVRALVVNLRGGELPAERNLALLVSQARAFLGRRETELARGAAEQAYGFVRTGADRREVEHLLGLIPRSHRRLRNKWSGLGWAAPVQLLPLLAVGMVLSLLWARLADDAAALFEAGDAAPAAATGVTRPNLLVPESGKLNVVTAERLTVRTGPGAAYRSAASLDKGTTLLVTELSPDGDWARILTATGLTGFVEAEGLRRRGKDEEG